MDKEKFSIVKRAKSFTHAGRGIAEFLRSTHNAWVELGIFAITVILGLYYDLSQIEWAMLVLASGLVIGAEAFNTAIEIDIDLTSPTYHPYARDTKDIAAGAVLISSLTAATIGILIFSAHI
jgi:diacylglycerol kinase